MHAFMQVYVILPLPPGMNESLGMIEGTCSVNKDQNNDDTKTVFWTLSVQGNLAHSLVSCWADSSFQSNTGDDRGKSAMPIRVPRNKRE